MSLLLDALKKAAEQKAKKGKQEERETPSADAAGIDDETGLEALLGRAGDSTQTDIGEPRIPLDDGELSMPYARGDSTDVRDPESLARAALGDDTDIRQPDETGANLGEDRIEFADTGEFGETGRLDELADDEDRTEFGETLVDEDRSEFGETLVDEDRTEFTDTGEFGGTLIEDRTEVHEAGEALAEDTTEFG